MSDNNNSSTSGGIGFLGLLTILFIGLKLGHVINWSWWWVLSPLWMPIGIILFICMVIGILAVIVDVIDKI
jgi:hypothetical protein